MCLRKLLRVFFMSKMSANFACVALGVSSAVPGPCVRKLYADDREVASSDAERHTGQISPQHFDLVGEWDGVLSKGSSTAKQIVKERKASVQKREQIPLKLCRRRCEPIAPST